jgi:CHC2 zinc finger
VVAPAASAAKNWWSDVLGDVPQDSSPGPTALDILAERGIFPVKEQPTKPKGAYLFHCPFHNDTHPSFAVHEDQQQWHCWTCGGGGPTKLQEMLGLVLLPPIPRLPKVPQPVAKNQERSSGCTLPPLAAAKRLPQDFLKSIMGWFDTDWYGTPAVGIEYGNGSLRYRVGLTGKDRFRWRKGSTPSLYWIDHLPEDAEYALVCEGETDVAAATFLGIPAVGVPGVDTWKPEWARQLPEKNLVLWVEPDQGGQNLADAMSRDIPGLRVIEAPPGIKDICELLAQAGAGAGEYLRELVVEAKPYWPERAEEQDVRIRVNTTSQSINLNSDISNIQWNSPLWTECCAAYVMPLGVKPQGRGHVFWHERKTRLEFIDLFSPGWGNPANRVFHQRKLRYNGIRELSGHEAWYAWDVAAEGWTDQERDALRKQVVRQGGEYIAFNTIEVRGVVKCLASVPVEGSTPLSDPERWLTQAIRDIRAPKVKENQDGRFTPLWGTRDLKKAFNQPLDKPKDELVLVGKSKNAEATDFLRVEANVRVAGKSYDIKRPLFKDQSAYGLSVYCQNWDEARDFVEGLDQYDLLPIVKVLSGEAEEAGPTLDEEEEVYCGTPG